MQLTLAARFARPGDEDYGWPGLSFAGGLASKALSAASLPSLAGIGISAPTEVVPTGSVLNFGSYGLSLSRNCW